MKGDFTRDTFAAAKHYQQVLTQQGRAQIDADLNEQAALTARRDETTTADVLGDCGGPADNAAFAIVTDHNALDQRDRDHLAATGVATPLGAGDFFLGAGRYYVDGVQCENEFAVPYRLQPDRLDVPALLNSTSYLLYLDVWQRHITAVEDLEIRETALGGPDTGTRVKTVWQLRELAMPFAPGNKCALDSAEFDKLADPGTAMLTADTVKQQATTDPCIIPPSAGFTGLENQLYRVEIHNAGKATNVNVAGVKATIAADDKHQVTVNGGGPWAVGTAVEVFPSKAGSLPMAGSLAWVTAVNGNKLTLSAPIVGITAEQEPKLRRVAATWKWSRDNGSVITSIQSINGRQISVSSLGADQHLGFVKDGWVEILDDGLELNGLPGQIAQIEDVDPGALTITLKTDVLPSVTANKARHPKLRRWDGIAAVKFAAAAADNWMPLESGVQVRFASAGDYRTGHWWQIPARTATGQSPSGDIEWPVDQSNRLALPPRGVQHRYCRIGFVSVDNNGKVEAQSDCRCLYPALTSVPRLFYVSGDGQERMPNLTAPGLLKLPAPLVVGVANAHCLDRPVDVLFKITGGDGRVVAQGGAPVAQSVPVRVNGEGQAVCDFHVDGTNYNQQVTARLLDANNQPVSLPIIFNASLSVAREVAYNPGDCVGLQGKKNVQTAIDHLATFAQLEMLAGDGQDAAPGDKLARQLEIGVTSVCGPVVGATVVFSTDDGGLLVHPAALAPGVAAVPVTTDIDGIARCEWTLGNAPSTQQTMATLTAAPGGRAIEQPNFVKFTANIREASSGECCVEVGEGGQFATIQEAIEALRKAKKTSFCICLLPGDHPAGSLVFADDDGVKIPRLCVRIEGCGGSCSRLLLKGGPIEVGQAKRFHLSNLTVIASLTSVLACDGCEEVIVEGCHVSGRGTEASVIGIRRATEIRVVGNTIIAAAVLKPFELNNIRVLPLTSLRTWNDALNAADDIVTKLSRLPIAALKNTTAGIITNLKDGANAAELRRIAGVETTFATALAGGAGGAPISAISLRPAVLRLLSAKALAILDADAETWILDNRIFGVVTMYGIEDSATRELFMIKAPLVANGKLVLTGTGRNAQVRGNTLTEFAVSESLFEGVDGIGPGQRVFSHLVIAENIVAAYSLAIAGGMTLSGNRLFGFGDADAMMILAAFACVVGNSATSGSVIRCGVPLPSARTLKEAANILLVIAFP